MKWLITLQNEYRSIIQEGLLYKAVEKAATANDFAWVRQLYHLSSDFTAAVALRYANCYDLRFRDDFGEHAAEEVTHPADLAKWLREFGFLQQDELPASVSPSLETLMIGSYLMRSVMREPLPVQVLTLNLMSEGVACDFYAAINPKLAELGLSPNGYWAAHDKADKKHENLGLELIPQCEFDSALGQLYARTLWEVASLFRQTFDSWSGMPIQHQFTMPAAKDVLG